MTELCVKGGRIIDPANRRDSVGDLFIIDDRVAGEAPRDRAVETIDASGCIVTAGAIDIHTHVAGALLSGARMLLDDRYQRGAVCPAPPDQDTAGRLYAAMGFTLVVEPAMSPIDAVLTHAELEMIPYIDRAALVVLGNEPTLLDFVRTGASRAVIANYVGAALALAKAIGVKAINPGGSEGFRRNLRTFDLDTIVPEWGITSREIASALRMALADLRVPHPLHLHTCNLGLPGNVDSALGTISAAEGEPLHLAHIQFYAYGDEGDFGVSSGAARLAEALVRNPNITADIGQVVFGPTVTVSADELTQFNARARANPKRWMILDAEGNGGGVVPYVYRRRSRVNALQWAIGLELFLLIDDPWRVFLTTDHPNGGPFTAYPDLIALLMSHDLRLAELERLPKEALETSLLSGLKREYSLPEIITMTRAAPAKLLGLSDRGHLAPGALADVAVYREQADRAAMFRQAEWVLKDGAPIVARGRLQERRYGRTLHVSPQHDAKTAAWPAVPETILRSQSPFEVMSCRT